jgi:hypothetical protein
MLTASNDQLLDDTIQMPPTKRLSARSLALKQQLNSSSDSAVNGDTLKDGTSDTSSDYVSTIGLCWQDNTTAQKQVLQLFIHKTVVITICVYCCCIARHGH